MDSAKTPETILVPLAEGFEEIEAVTIIDVLRRAELEVVVAGLLPGPVLGAHGIRIDTDTDLASVDSETIGMVVLPGGMPGTTRLAEDSRVLELLRAMDANDRPVAAICAAPTVLGAAGLLEGRRATSYPAFQDKLAGAEVDAQARVVRDGKVLTSQGVGTALEFALAIVADRAGEETARRLAEAMVVAP